MHDGEDNPFERGAGSRPRDGGERGCDACADRPGRRPDREGRRRLRAQRMARADQTLERVVDYAEVHLSAKTRDGSIVFHAGFAGLPAEIGLRLLGRAVGKVAHEGPVELGKLESLYDALAAAMAQKPRAARFRRTLAGALVTFTGEIIIERAPPRRSGRSREG